MTELHIYSYDYRHAIMLPQNLPIMFVIVTNYAHKFDEKYCERSSCGE